MTHDRRTKSLAILLTALLVAALPALTLLSSQPARAATVIHVTATGSTGLTCGTTWSNPCSLHGALAKALTGDEIWVAAGLYIPGESGDRSATFLVPAGVALYGGFAGTETLREQRDAARNLTILSGDIDRNDVAPQGDGIAQSWEDVRGANAYHVLTLDTTAPVDAGTVIDGFIITGGQADGPAPDDRGGGIACPLALEREDCSPTLRHLLLSGNSATYGGGMYTQAVGDAVNRPDVAYVTFRGNRATVSGGGLYSQNGSYPVLTEVMFDGNRAGTGGGLYSGGNRSLASITLSRVDFRNNHAEEEGGGVYLFAAVISHQATFSEVTFFENQANHGGALFSDGNRGDIDITMTQVTFENNYAATHGGAIAADTTDGGGTMASIVEASFIRNRADGSGGALSGTAGIGIVDYVLSHVTLAGNDAGGDGGGFHCTSDAGGHCAVTLYNALVTGNRAEGDGGGLSLLATSDGLTGARIVNATFAGNQAQWGGAIASRAAAGGSSRLELANSILWGDSGGTAPEIAYDSTEAAPILSYSLVQGWTNDALRHVWGDRDPAFVAPTRTPAPTTGGDYRLQLISPAIDAGDNESVPSGMTTDLSGAPRFVDVPSVPDTGNGTAPIVDMGAYECGINTAGSMQPPVVYLPIVSGRSR